MNIEKIFWILVIATIWMMGISFTLSNVEFNINNLLFVLTWVMMGILLGIAMFTPIKKKEIKE